MDGIIKDLSIDKTTIVISLDFDKPGLPNMIKATLKSIVKAFGWFYIKVYDIIQNVRKATQEAVAFVAKIPEMIKTVVTEFVSSFLDDLKIPQPAQSVFEDFKQWVGSIDMPAFVTAAVDFVLSIVKGLKSLPQAISEAAAAVAKAIGVDNLAAKINSAAASTRDAVYAATARAQRYATYVVNAAQVIRDWVEGTIKFIFFLLSLPALLIKAVFDFVKTSFVQLAKGIGNAVSSILDTFESSVQSQLNALGLSISIRDFGVPIVKLVRALIKAVRDLVALIISSIDKAKECVACAAAASKEIMDTAENSVSKLVPEVEVKTTA
jgi:hypothetical protein